MAGRTRYVRPVQAVEADLPLIRRGISKTRVAGCGAIADDRGQHIARYGTGDVPGYASGADGNTLVCDAVAQEVGRVGPYDKTGLEHAGGTALGRVQRALGQRNVVRSRGDDRIDAAVAEFDAALAHWVGVVLPAAIVGAEQEGTEVILQLQEDLVLATLRSAQQRCVRQSAHGEVAAGGVAEHVHVVVLIHVQAHHVHLLARAAQVGSAQEGLVDGHATDIEVVVGVVARVVRATGDVGGIQASGHSPEV